MSRTSSMSATKLATPPVLSGVLKRKCACGTHTPGGSVCESCRTNQVQRSVEAGGLSTDVPSVVHEVLQSPGQPLDTSARAFMEPRFGHNFGRVQVHTDARAAASARAVGAKAYTVGHHLVFDSRQYEPGTLPGRLLLAHELTHVVQQSGGAETIQRALAISQPSDPAEREADQVAHRLFIQAAHRPTIHRKATGLQRAVSTLCIAPFDLFTMGGLPTAGPASSTFGAVAETLIQANYCATMGCSLMATDFMDNPIPGSYIAFLVANNPHLNNARDIAALALIGITGLNRPDILTHKPARKDYYEIKPRSAAGITAGIAKLTTIQAFMTAYSLPYVFGTAYTPTPPEILTGTVMVGPWPLTVTLRAERIAPGLIAYDICFTGELAKIAIAALILIVLFILTRGRLPGRIPVPAPGPVPVPVPAFSPALGSAGRKGGESTSGAATGSAAPEEGIATA